MGAILNTTLPENIYVYQELKNKAVIMKTTIEVKSFPGFYETIFSERYIEEDEQESLHDQYPDFEHLSDWEIDSDKYRDAVAKNFAEMYIDELNDKLQLNIKLTSESVESPREYNFTSDKIICNIEVGDYDAFIKKITNLMCESEYRVRLTKIIKKKHSNSPGFWSFMSNDIEDWFGYLVDPDNTNYLECILWYLYCLKADEPIDGDGDWTMKDSVYEYIRCNTDATSLVPSTDAAREEYEQWQKKEEQKEAIRQLPQIPGLEC